MQGKVLVVVSCLFAFWMCCAVAQLEVTKEVTQGPKDSLYTVSIGYRLSGTSGRVQDVTLVDSLPKNLDLVSGDLVLKVQDPTEEWTYVSYVVKPYNTNFSLQNNTAEIVLPPAELIFATASIKSSVLSNTAKLTTTLSLPKGNLNLWPLVTFGALVFPLIASYYSISSYRAAELKHSKKRS